MPAPEARTRSDIAVVGMVGRFPGARDVEELWSNLCSGREGLTSFREEELDLSIPPELRRDPRYVRVRGILADCDCFDEEFFGMKPLEARLMDPQHRILLELAWSALETSGHRPSDFPGRIGVFVGANWNRYRSHCIDRRPEIVASFGELNTALANESDFLATRISYELGLRGPSCTIQTACSTSLVAIVQGAGSLIEGSCDLVLAGGVSVSVPVRAGHRYEEGGLLSADGSCRPFDKDATGTTFGDGAGLVVLRRLADALADGDQIHAVIRGGAINNDGDDKVGFAAPSVAGQAAVLRAALEAADVDPSTVGYIETHGTATPMGDPIEFAAIARAYGGGPSEPPACALGSVKSCVGHLVHAAGVTGFMMGAIAVRLGVIPPVLGFAEPNPRLRIAGTRFRVAQEARPWPHSPHLRRAGVSSFGVGGTNAHVVLEQPPEVASPRAPAPGSAGTRLLGVSARSDAALRRAVEALRTFLAEEPANISLDDVAFTLARGRERMSHRAAVAVTSFADAARALGDERRIARGRGSSPREVAFLFPGNGTQHAGMSAALYASESCFRRRVDHAIEFMRSIGGPDLSDVLRAQGEMDGERSSHLALFVHEVALAETLEAHGLRAAVLIGCSLGEFAAAVLAGVLSFEDALCAVLAVADASENAPSGVMLTAFCTEEEARSCAGPGVALAALHAPEVVVLAGGDEAIANTEVRLRERGVRSTLLPVRHPYHTAEMNATARLLEAKLARVPLRAPQRPVLSSALGRELGAAEAVAPAVWADILCKPMRFAQCLDRLGSGERWLLVEVGPGGSLTALALQHAQARSALPMSVSSSVPRPDASSEIGRVLAHAWANDLEIGGEVVGEGRGARRVLLPTYPFERTRHWLDAPEPRIPAPADAGSPSAARAEGGLAAPAPWAPAAGGAQELASALRRVLFAASGLEFDLGADAPWSELGLDSLDLTQIAVGVRREFRVEVSLRELTERCGSPQSLLERLTRERPVPSLAERVAPLSAHAAAQENGAPPKSPNPGARIERTIAKDHELGPSQRAFLERLIADYVQRTARSKASAQQHRRSLADPRTVSGFHPLWKEMVYPLVTERSKGSRLWDVDGNEYVDFLNGFGCILFGHGPDFVTEAVKAQIDRGIEIGPQSPLAGEVARAVCELTGNERVSFTNTGSEAVAAALRIARTVTGRDKVVLFEGAYHGIFDEVVVRAGQQGRALPGSPGIPRSHSAEVLVLPYGEESSLERIAPIADELAAVLVEPVQSRRPELQPVSFLRRLREITARSGTALVLDEVVTGFRTHPGGIQALFDVRADIALYGKVVAGGYPIGLVSGKARFLDALDGGFWRFGDASVPEAGVTFFAGTFVRHPVALAAARAVLHRLREAGAPLQRDLAERTGAMVGELRAFLLERQVGVRVESFSSYFFVSVLPSEPWGGLLFAQLRRRGIHIWEHFPCFLTTSHSDDDLRRFIECFRDSVEELARAGLLSSGSGSRTGTRANGVPDEPPVAGARRGRRADGTLAWFVADPESPGKYRELILGAEHRTGEE